MCQKSDVCSMFNREIKKPGFQEIFNQQNLPECHIYWSLGVKLSWWLNDTGSVSAEGLHFLTCHL